jgi:hypothetical protein
LAYRDPATFAMRATRESEPGLCAKTASTSAGVIQLGFILDESGSIGSTTYAIIQNGLANAIDGLIPTDSSYEISVVSFSTDTQTLVNHVLIDSAAARTAVKKAILADAFSGGSTAMDLAFDAMSTALTGSTHSIDLTCANFATDGSPTRNRRRLPRRPT